VRERTGVVLEVLTGDEEARLTFLAARRWFGWSAGTILMIDIGGGSLELAMGSDEEPDVAVSVPIGAGRLTRDFISADPPTAGELRELRRHVRAAVAEVAGQILRSGPASIAVATSKTFRQLARIAGAAPSAEGPYVRRSLTLADLSLWLPKLAEMTVAERAALPGVSSGRAAQLVAGACVAEAALALLEVPEVQICPWALREGLILRRIDWLHQ
jgi:exopolyphosphatase/guanosine-5'-triphosphate,3'-diphosphate pyrophosphatase